MGNETTQETTETETVEITESDKTSESSSEVENSSHKKSTELKEGDLLTLVRVRFPGNAKSFPFLIGKRILPYGQKVVAMSDRGMDLGYINSFPYEVKFNEKMLPLRKISKIAELADIEEQEKVYKEQTHAEKKCIELVRKYKLDMNITHVEYTQFGKKVIFYFNAPARVDFRELVKELVGELKMRIELRQISVRDRTAAIGAIGVCGLQTCCSSFLKNYGQVNIKLPKNQNLALIPSKINGICGQIKCCMKYEDQVYSEKRKMLPKEGKFYKLKNNDIGKVYKLHLLAEEFEMLTEGGKRRRYKRDTFEGHESLMPSSYEFPKKFDHITNETSTTISCKAEEKKVSHEEEELSFRHIKKEPHQPRPKTQNDVQEAPESKEQKDKSEDRSEGNRGSSNNKKRNRYRRQRKKTGNNSNSDNNKNQQNNNQKKE
jgi:cell fate regulator YaaT (PSP1 superfamily)